MTVCIAVMCENKGEEAIITVSDRMASMGGFVSGDNTLRKIDPILYNWTMMFAADDISPTVPILDEIAAVSTPKTFKEVVGLIKNAYKNQRNQQIEDGILQPLGYSMSSFLRKAKGDLSDRLYEKTFDRIRSYDLQIEFLVQGYDQEKREPHIFTIENPGVCKYWDKVGFWAIGSGQHQAIASLFATKYDRHDPLEVCVTKALVAKFMAESAIGVGKETWLLIDRKDTPNRSIFIEPAMQHQIRNEYDTLPKSPIFILPELKDTISKETEKLKTEIAAMQQSVAQTSTPEP